MDYVDIYGFVGDGLFEGYDSCCLLYFQGIGVGDVGYVVGVFFVGDFFVVVFDYDFQLFFFC